MEYASIASKYCCGVDLHARTMYVCIMDRDGKVRFHRNMKNDFALLVRALKPYRRSVSVGVESTYNWYWLADGCQEAGIPFYLGHALYMKAIHGGKKKNDRVDSRTVADLMRSNYFPLAYAYPQEMRATRDLLRRRHRFVALRAEGYSHVQNTFSQQANFDISHDDVRRKTSRRDIPGRLDQLDLSLSVDCDLDMIDALDATIRRIEKHIWNQAKDHDRKSLSILMTVPGVGQMLALTILYEIHTIDRFPSAQKLASYARLVKVDRSSDGKPARDGKSTRKIGNPHLKWAFSEIIVHAPRESHPIQRYYDRLQSKHAPGKAKGIMAHKFGIAVYYMLKNGEAFDERRFVS